MAKKYRLPDIDIAWSGIEGEPGAGDEGFDIQKMIAQLTEQDPGVVFTLLNEMGPGGGNPNFDISSADRGALEAFLQKYADGDEQTFKDFAGDILEEDEPEVAVVTTDTIEPDEEETLFEAVQAMTPEQQRAFLARFNTTPEGVAPNSKADIYNRKQSDNALAKLIGSLKF